MLLPLVNGYSIDCDNVAALAYSFGFSSVESLRNGCCNEVTCLNNRVTEIRWFSMSLSGTFNQTAFVGLSALTWLEIYYNTINGTLPTQYPAGFEYLDVDGNSFTGPVPVFPSTLLTFWGSRNQLSGPVPSFPNGIKKLYLDYNIGLTGVLVLDAPDIVFIQGTSISNIIVNVVAGLSDSGDCDITGTKICQSYANYLYGYCNLGSNLPTVCIVPTTTTKTLVKSTTKAPTTAIPTTTKAIPTTTTTMTTTKLITTLSTTFASPVTTEIGFYKVTSVLVLPALSSGLSIGTTVLSLLNPNGQTSPLTNSPIAISKTTTPTTTTTQTPPPLVLNTSPYNPYYSYMESSSEYEASPTQVFRKVENGLYGVTIDKLVTNPVFYGCIVLVIVFVFAMAFAREVQRKKRIDELEKKKSKNNGAIPELSFSN